MGDIEDRVSTAGEQTEEDMDEFNKRLQVDPEEEVQDENSFSTLGFPIGDFPLGTAPMKNIPLSALPNFHGLSSEDPDEFLFEFDILCRSVGSQFTFFDYLISCLHQCFNNIDFSSQISNERCLYSLRLSARLPSLSLRECEHEDFSFRGHNFNHYLNCRYLFCHHAYCAYLLLIFT